MPGTATYIVYQEAGSTEVLRTSDGSNLALPSNTPEDAIQAALDLIDVNDKFSGGPGDVYIAAGQYDITDPQFTGFLIHSYTNLHMDTRAQIRVPSGYQHVIFHLLSDDKNNIAGVTNSIIDGGRLTENVPQGGQPGALWTAFLLQGSAVNTLSGIQFNKIANTEITFAQVGLSIVIDAPQGYVNSNTFEFLRMTDCQTFVSFEIANLNYRSGTPIWANRFEDLQCECGMTVRTEIGIRNVAGNQNTFDSVKVWDIQNALPPALTLQVSSQANRTFVLGGILAGSGVDPSKVQDQGQSTVIFPP